MSTSVPEASASSMSARAYLEIRESIISGRLKPGQRLRERDLSVDLHVSRMPIREALGQLESEGFVVAQPRRGAVVRQLSLKDVEELFDIRLSLEVLAARQAAARATTGADLSDLRRVLHEADRATAEGHEVRIREVNALLHEEIVRLSGNDLLGEVMQPLVGRLRWLFALTKDRDPREQCREHHGLCEAIEMGHVELAGSLAYAHIELGRAPSMAALAHILPAR